MAEIELQNSSLQINNLILTLHYMIQFLKDNIHVN